MDLEVIRRILVEAKTTGVEQTTAQLKGLSAGYEGVTVASQKTETATESVARKFQAMESRLDPASRAARTLAKDISTLDQAFAQGGVSAQRHAELLEIANQNAIRMAGGAAKATGVLEGFRQTLSGVSGQLVGMAAGMGPVGIFLSALGPWGMAAAVGLNAVSSAIGFIVSESNRMGDKAIAFKELTKVTGLTAAQFSAIKHAASDAGLSTEGAAKALERLTLQSDDARQASGTLYTEIRKIDVGLADAIEASKTEAQFIDVLAKGYRNAGNEAAKAVIARAAFGRQGAGFGPVLGAIADAGGINSLTNSTHNLTEATDTQIEKWAIMKAQTDEMEKKAKNILASIFTEEGLAAQRAAAEGMIRVAVATKEIAAQKEGLSAVQRILMGIAQSSPIVEPGSVVQDNAMIAARQRLAAGTGSNLGASPADIESWNNFNNVLRGMEPTVQQTVKSLKEMQDEAAAATNKEKERVGALGNAATAQEKANVTLLALKQAFLEGKFGAQDSAQALADYKRAVDEVNHAANSLTLVHEAAIQTLRARTAAEREAAAAITARAGGGGDAEANAQRAISMEIEKQAQAHRDAMYAMQGQLAVAQAVTGIQKINAQEAATYRDLIDQGRTAEQASAEASKQKQIAIAQVNSAAQAQLQTLRDQYAVASAVTGAEKMRAQANVTINALLRQGVDEYLAQAVGAQELANAQAAATAAVEQSITGLQQQLEVLKASTQEEKDHILARQAYDNAVASGADAEAAMRLQAATEAVSSEKRRQAEENAKLKAQDAERLALAKQMNDEEAKYVKWIEEAYAGMHQLINEMSFNVPSASGGGDAEGMQRQGIPDTQIINLQAEVEHLKKQGYTQAQLKNFGGPNGWGIERGPLDPKFATEPMEMNRVRAQISGDKGAEISAVQSELAFYQRQPQTLENLNQIKSLMDTLKQLTTATEDQTAATKDSTNALSGLYSRQFGQGFYDGGAAVGELIYGLDNNTAGAIDAMQRAANDNTRNQNDLLTNLSQNQISNVSYMGAGIVSATNSVQGAVQSGFTNLTATLQQRAPTTPSPTTPSVTNPTPPSSPISPYYAHIPGTPSPWGSTSPGFARGGSFTTAGYGGDDSNVVAFRVSPQRERVTITPTSGGNTGGNGGGTSINNNNININVPQGTNEFRSTAMHIADEIFNQVAVAGRRR